MNLQVHYDSYRANVLADALPSYQEYCASRATKDPEKYPTIQSFLIYTTNNIRGAVSSGNIDLYKKSLNNHRVTLLTVFERMVQEYLSQFGEMEHEQRNVVILDMIERSGWKWFRFCPTNWIIMFDKMMWVPRYNRDLVYTVPAFDANEMQEILKAKPTKESVDSILKIKTDGVCKIINNQVIDIKKINEGEVRDWTQELFV